MFKYQNKPTFHTPFQNKNVVVVKWLMPEKLLPLIEVLYIETKNHTHGWTYEPSSE